MQEIFRLFLEGLQKTTWLEFIAVLFGIASVMFSRKENLLVYPTGLINTILYTYFCLFWWDLYAEASLNFYYTVMSIYGWILWAKMKKGGTEHVLEITKCNQLEWKQSIIFFMVCWSLLFLLLRTFTNSDVPAADSFASASAYTAMWLMARKKLENWIWWILTNIASIPLYFYKQAVFTSFQFVVLLVLAIMGYLTWNQKLKQAENF
ncbi:MAG: nicotinamide mononucleotide transporter, partial [Chitinophagaceae bacterium]|nr:nicotinamide mononucleotide transporter [Chitinophagaceae bacterium]